MNAGFMPNLWKASPSISEQDDHGLKPAEILARKHPGQQIKRSINGPVTTALIE